MLVPFAHAFADLLLLLLRDTPINRSVDSVVNEPSSIGAMLIIGTLSFDFSALSGAFVRNHSLDEHVLHEEVRVFHNNGEGPDISSGLVLARNEKASFAQLVLGVSEVP